MSNYKIDVWYNYNNKATAGYTLSEMFEVIKSGQLKNHIEEIRTFFKEGNKEEANKSKNELPGFTVSGIFNTRRRKEDIIKYYGLMILDIDNLKDEEEVKRIKEKICKIKYTKMAFVSPSGLGIKIIVETNNTDVEKHKEVYQEVVNYYKQELNVEFDKQTIDVSRLCFISSDGEAYLNLDSEIFISKNVNISKEKVVNEETIFTREESLILIEKEVIEFKNNCQRFEKGSRNSYVYLFAENCKGAGIIKEITIEYCLDNYVEEDFTEDEIITIIHSAYNNNKKVRFGQWKNKNKNLLKKYLPQKKI